MFCHYSYPNVKYSHPKLEKDITCFSQERHKVLSADIERTIRLTLKTDVISSIEQRKFEIDILIS